MEEEVGKCSRCKKTIFCMSGFLDGVINEYDELICFACLRECNQLIRRE